VSLDSPKGTPLQPLASIRGSSVVSPLMRVRHSPFDASAAGHGGVTQEMDFDWLPSTGGAPQSAATGGSMGVRQQEPVLPPHARQAGRSQMPQQTYQPVLQTIPSQTAQQVPQHSQLMAQQVPQQMAGPPQMMPQPGAAFVQGAMGSMGLNETVAGLVANQAMNQVANQIEASGLRGWFPNIFVSLQQLFNVGHSWVLRKLLLLLCPFLRRSQGAPAVSASGPVWSPGSDGPGGKQAGAAVGPDGLKLDVDDPDLYIPSMSYVTYILVYGVQRGMISDFRPEVLSSTASFALVLLILEVGAAKVGFYLAGKTTPVLGIVANCGYKYVGVCLMVVSRILTGNNPIYYVFFVYLSACAAWSTRRFMLHFEPSQLQQHYGVAPSKLHSHIILGLAIAQIPLCWLLTPSTRGARLAPSTT